MDTPERLTSRQKLAVEALVRGDSLEKVAEEASVSVRTLFDWRRTEAFRAALKAAQDLLFADQLLCEVKDVQARLRELRGWGGRKVTAETLRVVQSEFPQLEIKDEAALGRGFDPALAAREIVGRRHRVSEGTLRRRLRLPTEG